MRTFVIFVLKFLMLAAAYACVGRLSLMLAIPPGFASPVWPAAGVALAGVLLGGRKMLPAVFAGSLIINFLSLFYLHVYILFSSDYSSLIDIAFFL